MTKTERAARAWSIGAAGFCIGFIVCIAMYWLRSVDFKPMQDLVKLEEHAYLFGLPPPLPADTKFHSIIFVDIDDYAINHWHPASFRSSCGGDVPVPAFVPNIARGTPRGLIAAIAGAMRNQNAGVIFLDYDLRNKLDDDDLLRDELKCPSGTKILIPRFFATGMPPDCPKPAPAMSQADKSFDELETVFDADINKAAVEFVHPVLVSGEYGLVDGVCESYGYGGPDHAPPRFAAMVRAVSLVERTAPGAAGNNSGPIPIDWWVDDKTTVRMATDPPDRPAYIRLEASWLLRDNKIDLGQIDSSRMKDPIVIVGSTHKGAGDVHPTPFGNMPGSVIQANVAITRQLPPKHDVPLRFRCLAEVVFVVLPLSAFSGWYFGWHSTARWNRPLRRLLKLGLELLMAIAWSSLLFGGYFAFAVRHYDMTGGFHLGVVSLIVGAIVIFLIEFVAALTDAVEAGVERWMERRESGDSRSVAAGLPKDFDVVVTAALHVDKINERSD